MINHYAARTISTASGTWPAQLAAAIGADLAGIEHAALARQMGRQLLAATFPLVLLVVSFGLIVGLSTCPPSAPLAQI
jgi:hypothetical protein